MKFVEVSLALGNLVNAEEKQDTQWRGSTGVLSNREKMLHER